MNMSITLKLSNCQRKLKMPRRQDQANAVHGIVEASLHVLVETTRNIGVWFFAHCGEHGMEREHLRVKTLVALLPLCSPTPGRIRTLGIGIKILEKLGCRPCHCIVETAFKNTWILRRFMRWKGRLLMQSTYDGCKVIWKFAMSERIFSLHLCTKYSKT